MWGVRVTIRAAVDTPPRSARVRNANGERRGQGRLRSPSASRVRPGHGVRGVACGCGWIGLTG